MIATPKDWRITDSAEGWMRQQEKRMMHEERRPRITQASDLLGPGIGPYAIQIDDWSGEKARFNGFFYSDLGAANNPDLLLGATLRWLGLVIAVIDGFGIQIVWSYDPAGSLSGRQYQRAFTTPNGAVPLYTDWSP